MNPLIPLGLLLAWLLSDTKPKAPQSHQDATKPPTPPEPQPDAPDAPQDAAAVPVAFVTKDGREVAFKAKGKAPDA